MPAETIGKWIAADAINDTHIDWGTGTNQVSADDVPDGVTNIIPTATQETNWDNHLGNTNNPHGVTASQAGAIADNADQVDDTHIDWGSGANQINASKVPILDADSIWTATNVDDALDEMAEQLIGMFDFVAGFTADGGSDDADTAIDAAAIVNTARTNWTAGKGVFVDASGNYSSGASLPANGVQVTELGTPGCVFIRDNVTKDSITDGAGNNVYGILFYDTSDSKYYIKYFSDVDDVQTAYTGLSSKVIDFYFVELFYLKGLDPKAIVKGGILGGTDVASTVNAATVTIADADGNYTAANVEAALAEQMAILAKATLSSGDISAGWKSFATKARGAAGEKTYVQLTPIGGPPQQYAVDYTAMNNDANEALIIIWKTSGAVTGIASPTYPSTGLAAKLAENDIIQIAYNK